MIEEICEIEDSLLIARDKYPGQRNSLDALATRYDISGYDRTFHGALLDANILADVYMRLTGGQSKFEFSADVRTNAVNAKDDENKEIADFSDLVIIKSSKDEMKAHEERLLDIEKNNNVETIWRKF